MPDSTRFVESSNGYERPPSPQSRIRDELERGLKPVDQNGRTVSKPAGVTAPPTTTGKPITMVDALTASAERTGADLAVLLDSERFCSELATIAPSDSAALDAALRDAMPSPPISGMPTPGGGSRSSVPTPRPQGGSLLELATQQIRGNDGSHIPEGYRPA